MSEGGGTHENWKTESYVGRLFTWLTQTFPDRPHVLQNGAIGGTTTVYYGQCVQDFVPESDIDLVIVEFTVNDKLLLDFQGNATDYAKCVPSLNRQPQCHLPVDLVEFLEIFNVKLESCGITKSTNVLI